MIETSTGYRIVLNNSTTSFIDDIKKPFETIKDGYNSTVEGIGAINDFFSDMTNEGLWFAITGQYFGEWVHSMFINFLRWLVSMSDLLMLAGVGVLLLIMFGSVRSRKWLYWIVCSYIMFQILGWVV